MSILRDDNVVALIKNESTYDVDAVPTAADAMLLFDIDVDWLSGKYEERKNHTGRPGSQGRVQLQGWASVKFSFELQPVAAAGDLPHYHPIMLSSFMSHVVTVDTDVQYTPISNNNTAGSATMEVFYDGVQHIATGMRGSIDWQLGLDGIPRGMFNGFAFLTTIAGATAPIIDLSALQQQNPLVADDSSVVTCSLFAQAMPMTTCKFVHGEQAKAHFNASGRFVASGGRGSKIELGWDEPTIAEYNWWSVFKAQTSGAFAYQLGSMAGKIFELTVPNVQADAESLKRPSGGQDGIQVLRGNVNVVPTALNNDFVVTVR